MQIQTPTDPALDYQPPPDRQPGEPAHCYQVRVLEYVLQYSQIEVLSTDQLESADSAAAWSVAQLGHQEGQGGTLTPDEARLNDTLHAVRLRLQARLAAKRAQLASLQRLLDQADQTPPTGIEAVQDADAAADALQQQTPEEQAARLLRAALQLLLGPQQPPNGNGGGRPARLQPPPPTKPSPGQAQQPPHVPTPRRF
jgi:hypothetical protein